MNYKASPVTRFTNINTEFSIHFKEDEIRRAISQIYTIEMYFLPLVLPIWLQLLEWTGTDNSIAYILTNLD